MLNPFQDVKWNPGRDERVKFARSLVIGFPIVAILMLLAARVTRHQWIAFPFWLGGIGAAVGAICWAVPRIARPFYLAWYFLACCMGFVMGNLLLSLFFYLLLTPASLLLRLFGRKLMRKGFDRAARTYWKDAEKGVDPKRYYRQF